MADTRRAGPGMGMGMADHHDYAKRRHDPPPPPPKKGRQHRDPEGGIYISARSRARKAPLPMKLRALPASFWEQPNLNKGPSPGTIFAALPPLCKDAEPSGSSSSAWSARGCPDSDADGDLVSPADTDLLFSLFRSVESMASAPVVRKRTRGRPRRSTLPAASSGMALGGAVPGAAQRDDDPCLLDSLTGGLLSARQQDGPAVSLSVLNAGREAVLRGGVAVDSNNLAQILTDLVFKL